MINNIYCLVITTIIMIFLLKCCNKIKTEKRRRFFKLSILFFWFPIPIFIHPIIFIQVGFLIVCFVEGEISNIAFIPIFVVLSIWLILGAFVYYTKFKRPIWFYPSLGILFSFLLFMMYRLS